MIAWSNNAVHVKEVIDNDAGECGISIDGTWQKRGYSSHNGVVTATFSRPQKCLDVEVLSDKCQQCLKWSKKQNDPKYQEWKSQPPMQRSTIRGVLAAWKQLVPLRIFERSRATRGLKIQRHAWRW